MHFSACVRQDCKGVLNLKWAELKQAVLLEHGGGKTLFPADPWTLTWNGPYLRAVNSPGPQQIKEFLGAWKARVKVDTTKVGDALVSLKPYFDALTPFRFEYVDFGLTIGVGGTAMTVKEVISKLGDQFDAKTGLRWTATSKALHALLPNLLVPFDMSIRAGYGCHLPEYTKEFGEDYAKFHLRLKKEADELVADYCGSTGCAPADAANEIRSHFYTGAVVPFTRLLDIYNYKKYREGRDELW